MKPFTIAFDARPLSTSVSGVGRLIAETLIHFPEKEKFQFHGFSHLPIHESHRKVLDLPNIVFHEGRGQLAKKGGLYFLFQMPFVINELKPDLYWGSQQVTPIFLSSSIPTVLTYCDLVLYLFPDTMRTIAAIQQKFFQSSSVKKAKYILSISENTRNDLLKKFTYYPREKTGVAYPGVSLKEIESKLKEKCSLNLPEKYLLAVSTIEPRKNYPFLLNVFREYRKLAGVKKLPLVIVGKRGWERSSFFIELEEEIKTHKDIFWFENTSDIELHHIYSRAEVFIFTTIYEGFGIPLLEAIAHKKKCIASNVPTLREIGEGVMPFLDLDDPKKFASEILVLQDEKKYPIIDLEKFSWQASSKITHDAFLKVLT
ncbi:MAG: glycosyltransferase family 1 protein [Leptospiraceae bacterium]|nr:glycosyltransferase family 1 protein [Leptospiraceae bacterium]